MNEAAARDLFGTPLSMRPRSSQLPLPLGWRNGAAPQLIVGESNRAAIDLIFGAVRWTSPAVVLSGPAGSGKSLIGRLFESRGGTSVDPLEAADEEQLFHRWNRAREEGGRLLVVVDAPDARARIRLPDLATRLATAQLAQIGAPDACLTRDLVEHLLTQRGLVPAAQLGAYVAARIERSYPAIHAAVAAIDAAALATGGGASIRTARDALIRSGLVGATAGDGTEAP